MNVYNFMPYCPKSEGKNLGVYYNKYMDLLPNDDDWAILIDHDIMFTTYDWYNQICHIVKKHDRIIPDVGLFTAKTPRIGNPYQLVESDMLKETNDIKIHRKYGDKLYRAKYDRISPLDKVEVSGLLMVVKKSVWSAAGGFLEKGILGVDTDFHWRLKNIKKRVYIMEGVYLYHWYRNNLHKNNTHLL